MTSEFDKAKLLMIDIRTQASIVERKFASEWGSVRRFLASHPLTGAWGFATVGLVIGWLAGRLL